MQCKAVVGRFARGVAIASALGLSHSFAYADEKPQMGGTLNIGNVYVTLSPLSWDPGDWAWKFGQDTGLMYEQLFVGDLSKAKRKGGEQLRPDSSATH